MDGPAGCATRCCGTRTSFMLSFTENLMTYALGRRVEHYDMPTVRAIVRDAASAATPPVVVRRWAS